MIIRFWRGFNRVKRGRNGGLFAFIEDLTFLILAMNLSWPSLEAFMKKLYSTKQLRGTPLKIFFKVFKNAMMPLFVA